MVVLVIDVGEKNGCREKDARADHFRTVVVPVGVGVEHDVLQQVLGARAPVLQALQVAEMLLVNACTRLGLVLAVLYVLGHVRGAVKLLLPL